MATKKSTTKTPPVSTFERVRVVCYGFPGVEEKLSYGAPSFHVRGKLFATYSDDGGGALMVKLSLERQRELVAEDPERFSVPAYLGPRGWLTVRLDHARSDWDELTILVEEAWSAVVPAKVALGPVRPPPPPPRIPTTDPAVARAALDKVEAIVAQLGDVTTEEANGHATYKAGGKVFAYFLDNHHGDETIGIVVKTDPGDNEDLVAKHPGRFYMPAYVGKRGWVGVRLDRDETDWKDVAARIRASHAAATVKAPAGGTRGRAKAR